MTVATVGATLIDVTLGAAAKLDPLSQSHWVTNRPAREVIAAAHRLLAAALVCVLAACSGRSVSTTHDARSAADATLHDHASAIADLGAPPRVGSWSVHLLSEPGLMLDLHASADNTAVWVAGKTGTYPARPALWRFDGAKLVNETPSELAAREGRATSIWRSASGKLWVTVEEVQRPAIWHRDLTGQWSWVQPPEKVLLTSGLVRGHREQPWAIEGGESNGAVLLWGGSRWSRLDAPLLRNDELIVTADGALVLGLGQDTAAQEAGASYRADGGLKAMLPIRSRQIHGCALPKGRVLLTYWLDTPKSDTPHWAFYDLATGKLQQLDTPTFQTNAKSSMPLACVASDDPYDARYAFIGAGGQIYAVDSQSGAWAGVGAPPPEAALAAVSVERIWFSNGFQLKSAKLSR